MKKINNNLFNLRFLRNQILISAFSILLGGLIYVMLRPSPPKFFETLYFLGLTDVLESLRGNTVNWGHVLPDWLVFSLPNGLWSFSYTFLIITIWGNQNSAIKYLWLATIPVLIFGFEFLQYFDLLRGTFSIPDMIAGLSGILTAITIKLLTTKTYNNEKNST